MRPAKARATSAGVTATTGEQGPATGAEGARAAWETMRADGDIQFAPLPPPPPREPPEWQKNLSEWLDRIFGPLGDALASFFGSAWPVVEWVLIALLIAGVGVLLWKLFRADRIWGSTTQLDAEEESWAPERSEALALLDEADRLASEGRYDEATHLLLQRSVGQIAQARPGWVEPSSTARELAALNGLPEKARAAFGIIASRVERSLFALRSLGRDDWQAARDAYADFALESL